MNAARALGGDVPTTADEAWVAARAARALQTELELADEPAALIAAARHIADCAERHARRSTTT